MRAVRAIMAMAGAATLVGIAVPAHAASVDARSCTVTVSLPSELVIKGWSSGVTAKLSDPTGCVDHASWGIAKGTEDTTSLATFSNPDIVDRVSFYTGPSGNHAGSYRAYGSHASSDDTFVGDDGYDESVTVVQTDSAPMVAKYASKLTWVSAARSGTKTTLKARAARWTPFGGFGGYVRWKHAEVLVQQRVGGDRRTVKTALTDSKGSIDVRVSGAASTWRLATTASDSVWGARTSSKHR